MPATLHEAIATLRAHESELRRRGVAHAWVFGSVARGEATSDSDVDVLVELDPDRPIGVFEYASLTSFVGGILEGAEVVNRRTVKPLLRENIFGEAVHAFEESRTASAGHSGQHRRR